MPCCPCITHQCHPTTRTHPFTPLHPRPRSVVDVRVGTTEEQSNAAHYRFGPTRFSVIPKAAVGKISIRFVPEQDAAQLVELLQAHIRHEFAKLRSPNSISIKVGGVGGWRGVCWAVWVGESQVLHHLPDRQALTILQSLHPALCNPAPPTLASQVHSTGDWWEASPDSAFMRMAERALQKEWGVEPLLVREGESRRCSCRRVEAAPSCIVCCFPAPPLLSNPF